MVGCWYLLLVLQTLHTRLSESPVTCRFEISTVGLHSGRRAVKQFVGLH